MTLQRKWKIIITATVIAAVAAAAFYGIFILRGKPLYPWLKKGASSLYVGSKTYSVKGTVGKTRIHFTVTVTIRLTVLEVNKTHYHLRFLITYEEQPTGGLSQRINESWIPISSPSFLILRGYRLNKTIRTQKIIHGLGMRSVIVRKYVSVYNESTTITVIIDEKDMWPLEFIINEGAYGGVIDAVISAHNFNF